ncbi:unnamed protein product [Spodoptera exigua]|nr:unnamed protein product [Spodoptera exigua]
MSRVHVTHYGTFTPYSDLSRHKSDRCKETPGEQARASSYTYLLQGIDFKQKIINLDGVPIKLQIWDTAGQERFRTLTTAYYRGAMGIILMYDITNLESFNHLSYWLRNIQEYASPDVIKVLVGNKCDVHENHRAVPKERGQKIADDFDMPFFEVSCKSNINIEEAFLTLARKIREYRETKVPKDNRLFQRSNTKKNSTSLSSDLSPD